MTFRYSTEHIDFLREGFASMPIHELTVAFNQYFETDKSLCAIKTVLKCRGITCGRKGNNRKGVYTLLTAEQVAFVIDVYKEKDVNKLTAALNEKFNIDKSVKQIRYFIKNHKIKSGRTGCFSKDNKPWNKKTKGEMKANSGSFVKGQKAINIKPVGSERICSKDGYILIKINESDPYTTFKTRWRAKHIVIWEELHGKIPKAMVVSFVDGNKLNCVIGNLELITRAEILYRNRHGYNDLPDELKPNMRALAKLETKRFSLEKRD